MEKTFPQRIYHLVSLIPSGKVSTYGQLALLAGSPRSARIVGAALAKAPAGLPCHRVLYRDGTLCCDQAFGGKDVQRKLLEQEGVPFLPDGRVDLKHCLWQPDGNLWDSL
ncbi:methylated-DNA-[protein]-cysteine S-methyltransferase [Clostridium sp. CAG:1013]|jgi:methylated-DNA-protein-cysteine methyltransferase-like protein|nr:methylated-DNA-[protein]-cysteine S-methyltransferase [Clostridium sp. CAG:1013]